MAIPFVAVGVAVVLVLLLLLLANPTWQKAIQSTIAGVPLIGGWLADNSLRLQVYLFGLLASWANAGATALASWITAAGNLASQGTAEIANLASAVHENAVYIRYTVIPLALAQAKDYTDARVGSLETRTQLAARLAASVAAAQTAAAVARADAQARAGIGYAQALWSSAIHYAQTLWVAAVGYAGRLFVEARLETQAAEVRAETYAAAQTATAERFTLAAYLQAVGYTERVAGDLRDYTTQRVGSEQVRAQTQEAGIVAWAAGVSGVLAAAVAEIENSRCMRQCDTLGQIGEFNSALDVGLLLGLVAEARAHPAAAVAFFRNELAPTLAALGRDTEGLVGG